MYILHMCVLLIKLWFSECENHVLCFCSGEWEWRSPNRQSWPSKGVFLFSSLSFYDTSMGARDAVSVFFWNAEIFNPCHVFFVIYLQDKPYDKDDDVIKATYFQVMSTLRDVLKTTSLWRDHVRTYTQACSLHIWHCLRVKNMSRVSVSY